MPHLTTLRGKKDSVKMCNEMSVTETREVVSTVSLTISNRDLRYATDALRWSLTSGPL